MEYTISFEGGKKIHSKFRGFVIQTDQPKEDGGDNTAPTPFDLFLSSIGTCAGFYVLSFCEARELSTSGISLDLKGLYNEDAGRLETVQLTIQLPAEFPEKYKKALIRTAEQCSVKKAIMNPPVFKIATQSKAQ